MTRGSTPLVRANRERTKNRALRDSQADGYTPLIYFGWFSGRPGQITIGRTSADPNANRDEPRLGDHTRGAGKVVRRLWAKGAREIELRLHQAFRDEQMEDELEWFAESRRIQGYLEEALAQGHVHEDWRAACGLSYLHYFPRHAAGNVGVGQLDIFGNVRPVGRVIDDLDDYQTPHLHAEISRLALTGGRIELDPATSHGANERVIHADRIFFAHPEHDGLANEWHAETLYCNPPWSQDGVWARKLRAEHEAGRVGAAVLALGDTAMSKGFWADFGPYPLAQAIGRPAWKQYDGVISPPCGGIFLYIGPPDGEERFHRAFSLIAHVYGRKKKATPFAGVRLSPAEQWNEEYVRRLVDEWGRKMRLR